MKRPALMDRFDTEESSADEQMMNAVVDALSANDKVIEIRPANRSNRMGLKTLLLLGAAVIVLAYWARSAEKSDDLVERVKERAATRTDQAVETIEEGSETASERIEEGSERAGETVKVPVRRQLSGRRKWARRRRRRPTAAPPGGRRFVPWPPESTFDVP